MLKVGDFSKLAQVTVKALRHYDELGLLKPVYIDRYTGYRYYALSQLPRLQRILALKEMGFSLAQAGAMLNDELSPEALRRLFNQKQAELAEHVQAEQARLQRVAERLEQLEQAGRLPDYEITLRSLPEQTVLARRVMLAAPAALEERLSRLRAELNAWASAYHLPQRGQWMTLHHSASGDRLDIEATLLLEEDVTLPAVGAPFQVRRLPYVPQAACTLHHLGERPLNAAYTALYAWIERQGYEQAGPARELLLEDPAQKKDPVRFVEVQFPIASLQERKTLWMTNPLRKENEMEPKIVSLPAFTVVGVRYFGKNQSNEIAGLWDVFNRRAAEIQHVAPDSAAYGICQMVAEAQPGEFEYVASLRVNSANDVPPDMVAREVAAHQYAVFTHIGPLTNLKETYDYIYQVWLPQSGYEIADNLDFEWYDDDFKFGAPDSRFYIYVAIKPSAL